MTIEALLRDVEQGLLPSADGAVDVVPAPRDGPSAVLGFTGHVVIAADVDPSWVRARQPELGDPFLPPLLADLAAATGRRPASMDLLALAPRATGPAGEALTAAPTIDHPRVRRARRFRTDVYVWCLGDDGVLIVGRGLGGRWEVAVEVADRARGQGIGRRLATAATHLVPEDRPLWAQIAPGNAASIRAFLAAGYKPVGQEALLV